MDGSGTVNVTGRPALWTAFKSLPLDESDPEAMKAAARELFESSGLEVKRVTVTKRRGHRYLFVSAEFEDVNRISYTPAFPDLRVGLRREGGRLLLDGSWQRPLEALPGRRGGPRGADGGALPPAEQGVRPPAGGGRGRARQHPGLAAGDGARPSTAAASSSAPRWTSAASSPRR